MKTTGALAILTLAACGGTPDRATGDPTPLIAVHLAHQEDGADRVAMSFEGQQLFVERQPVISDPDLERVDAVRRGEGVILDLGVAPGSAERLRATTAANVGRTLVLMFDARVVGTPTIRSEIRGSRIPMVVPAASAAEAADILASVRARWPAETTEAQTAPGGRNTVYAEVFGNSLFFGSINYEHMLSPVLSARIGVSPIAVFPLMLNYLPGRGPHRGEAGIGMLAGGSDVIAGTLTLGYRYQPPAGGLVFRVGWTPLVGRGGIASWGGASLGFAF